MKPTVPTAKLATADEVGKGRPGCCGVSHCLQCLQQALEGVLGVKFHF